MLNFNPYFKQQDPEGDPFVSKTYASDIVNILYPEDILSSEIEKSSDVSSELDYTAFLTWLTLDPQSPWPNDILDFKCAGMSVVL